VVSGPRQDGNYIIQGPGVSIGMTLSGHNVTYRNQFVPGAIELIP
jgi:hypothetical protein